MKNSFLALVFLFSSLPAFADYTCQIVTEKPHHLESMSWDGEPFQYTFPYRDGEATWRVQEIGLAGHPEFLFELRALGRVVMDMSQAKGLADYVFTWKSGEPGAGHLISIVCR